MSSKDLKMEPGTIVRISLFGKSIHFIARYPRNLLIDSVLYTYYLTISSFYDKITTTLIIVMVVNMLCVVLPKTNFNKVT